MSDDSSLSIVPRGPWIWAVGISATTPFAPLVVVPPDQVRPGLRAWLADAWRRLGRRVDEMLSSAPRVDGDFGRWIHSVLSWHLRERELDRRDAVMRSYETGAAAAAVVDSSQPTVRATFALITDHLMVYVWHREDSPVFAIVTNTEYETRLAGRFCELLCERLPRFGSAAAQTTAVERLVEEFQTPARVDAISAIRADLAATEQAMVGSAAAIAERGRLLEDLVADTVVLARTSETFARTVSCQRSVCARLAGCCLGLRSCADRLGRPTSPESEPLIDPQDE